MDKQQFIILPTGVELELENIIQSANELKKNKWVYEEWKHTTALVELSGSITRKYNGQSYDPRFFKLVADGWTHDHCEICFKVLSTGGSQEIENNGFNCDNLWVCKFCYENFIVPSNLKQSLEKFKKIEK